MAKNKPNETTVQIDEFEKSIRNYANEIEVISSFPEAVRRLPGEYIGNKGNKGWKSCIREILQNAFDECVRQNSPCHYVRMIFDERNQSAVIEDQGRGIPHGKMIEIYSTQHSSSNYSKKPFEYTSGVHGVGAGVAMALSKKFTSDSYVLGEGRRVEFDKGVLWKYGEKPIKCPPGRQGTTVYMEPDLTILDHVNLTCVEIFSLIQQIYTMSNIGDRFDFTGIDINGAIAINEKLVNTDGMATNLFMMTEKPIIAPIHFSADDGFCRAEVVFTYDAAAITESEDISSYANFTPTNDGGTHVDGFIDGLCQYFRYYMNRIYLPEKSKISVTNVDIRTGLKAVVFGACLNPVFAGQFKGILTSEEMKPFIKDLTVKSLEQWAKEKPNDLQRVAKYLKDIADVRTKSNETKVKLTSNYESSALGEYPKKFVKPSGKKNIEFFIVEGDSALGGIENGRDHARQGIFPIRGKLPNAFARNKTEILNNQEVSAIIRLVTGDKVYKKNFDVSQVKWDKIIILADADPDGSHISTLVLRLFLVFMPQVIAAGKLYKAIPPLYSVGNGKKKTYFATKADFAKFIQQTFNKSHVIEYLGKDAKKLTPNECIKLFYKNIDYAYNINILSNIFAVDPMLLELVLFNLADAIDFNTQRDIAVAGFAQASVAKSEEETKALIDHSIVQSIGYSLTNLNFSKLKKSIEKAFRFMHVDKRNGTTVIEGEVNDKYQYVFINDYFIRNCIDVIRNIMLNDYRYYKLDDRVASIYEIMSVFDNTMPTVKRYKGLGEMDSSEAAESTLSIENRTLIRYTLESAKEEINSIRYIDSNVSSLLSNITISRQDVE